MDSRWYSVTRSSALGRGQSIILADFNFDGCMSLSPSLFFSFVSPSSWYVCNRSFCLFLSSNFNFWISVVDVAIRGLYEMLCDQGSERLNLHYLYWEYLNEQRGSREEKKERRTEEEKKRRKKETLLTLVRYGKLALYHCPQQQQSSNNVSLVIFRFILFLLSLLPIFSMI